MAGGACLLGTLAVQQLSALPSALWCVPFLLVVLLLLRYRALQPLLCFAVAAAWTAWVAADRLEKRLALGGDFALIGTVASFPATAPGQITFTFAVAKPRPPGVPAHVRLTWYEPPAVVALGDTLEVTARLRPPRGARNPGGFDYEQWLLVNDLGATGYVRAGAIAEPTASVAAAWWRFRATLAARLRTTNADGAALLTALALGERFRFTEQHWTDFRRTGTSHLVAVSGMHVALLGLVVFGAVRWVWLRLPAPLSSYDLEVAGAASALATLYYAALTGFAVPAQRSLVMVAIALAALVSRRSLTAPQLLAATLIVVLAWDPFASLAPSFWLSFAAVAVLLGLAAPRPLSNRPRGRARRWLELAGAFVRLQWWIGLALVPLTAWYFGEISLVGPLVNLVAIPWFNLVLVPLSVLATVALSFDALAALAAPLVEAAAALASVTVSGLHVVAGTPGATVSLPQFSALPFAVAASGVAFAVFGAGLPGRHLAWLALLPMFLPIRRPIEHGTAEAVVLDVGHGLAVIVETHSHRLVFDAGPTSRSGFDTGTEVVLPALAARGARGLDLLIVSHADNDHAGGAAAVAAAFPGIAVLRGRDVELAGRFCERGQEWEWDGVRFSMLHPSSEFGVLGNDGSCVLKVAAGSTSLLLTGDIERRAESVLLGQALDADVVVVPHHGSATSSSTAFVAAVGARTAIVSAGYENRWNFPRPEVRERWERNGATMLVTGDVGAVHIALGGHGSAIAAERDGRHRYWQTPKFPW